MKEKRTHVTRKKRILSLLLIAVLVMMFSSTVSADTEDEEDGFHTSKRVYELDDIADSTDPVFVSQGDVIRKGGVDLETKGMRIRYELSESSDEVFPGTQPYYNTSNHTVHGYELNGRTYDVWRVKYASTDDGDFNVILIPANNGSSHYTGYFHNWTNESGDPGIVTIKNTVEPENCYANFVNGSHRVIIDEGTNYEKKLVYEEDFDVYYGSAVIEIDPSIIKGLQNGNHTIRVNFRDGNCKVNFVKDWDKAYATGSQPINAAVETTQQTSQQSVAQDGVKKAPKTGEI